jgi:hypothetical protein
MALVDLTAPPHQELDGRATVALSALPVGHAWRQAGLDEAHVMLLAANYGSLPPVLVDRFDLTVVDGAHRVAAARRLGMHSIAVEWFEGTRVEAFREFVARNSKNGLTLTAEDRERGVLLVLGAQPTWSDRRIAELTAVSPKMVARLRTIASAPGGDLVKRVGRDGRSRPVRPGAMRAMIAEALASDPAASLRAIASKLGVSPETVRSVRKEVGIRRPTRPEVTIRERCLEEVMIERLLQRHHRSPAPWRCDNAFQSTVHGVSFVDWFDATAVSEGEGRVDEVPLSRVYDIADEARRRADFWSGFAHSLEARTRRTH